MVTALQEVPPQPEPQPGASFSILKEGLLIEIKFGGGLVVSQLIPEAAMVDICSAWKKSREQLHKEQRIAQDIARMKEGRNGG